MKLLCFIVCILQEVHENAEKASKMALDTDVSFKGISKKTYILDRRLLLMNTGNDGNKRFKPNQRIFRRPFRKYKVIATSATTAQVLNQCAQSLFDDEMPFKISIVSVLFLILESVIASSLSLF